MTRSRLVVSAIGLLASTAAGAQSWRLEGPSFTIGSEADANEQFAGIASVLLTNTGVLVANGGTKQLRYFDSRGQFIRQTGREGSGPGEYREFARVFRLPGDSIGIYDGWARRLSIVGPSGEFARSVALARPPGATGGPTPIGSFDDGSIVSFVATPPTPAPGQERGALHRLTATWYRHDATGGFRASLGRSPAGELFLELSEGMVVNWAPPFQRTLRVAVSRDRVFAGDGTVTNVVMLARDSIGSGLIQLNSGNLSVTSTDVAAYRREQLDRAPTRHHRTQLEKSFEKTPSPPTMPAFGDLRVDTDGRLWVQDYRRPGASTIRWRVLSPQGATVATIDVPKQFAIRDIGRDRIAGIWFDENDVETVRVYQLRR